MWGYDNWDWDYFFFGAIKGGVSGALTAGVGGMFHGALEAAELAGTSILGLSVAQAAVHGHVQGVFSAMTGGDYATTFITSVVASGVGAVLAPLQEDAILAYLAFDATIGGVTSKVMGGNFWEGFTTSLMIVGLNHCGPLLEEGVKNVFTEKFNKEYAADQQATIDIMKKLGGEKFIDSEGHVAVLQRMLVFKHSTNRNGEVTSMAVGIVIKGEASFFKKVGDGLKSELTPSTPYLVGELAKTVRQQYVAKKFSPINFFLRTARTANLGAQLMRSQPFSLNSVPLTPMQRIQNDINFLLPF